uniref:TATA box-binding protein-like 1 n=1 Tax=Noctiluca scintillans TaxID=2966 RepID=A0A7S1AJV1_NOCSC|mmetsp:Transcript_49346/g.130840  ORF Transcript_49346/g.130840 Transcript_49346/m.130840 type:complete len:263 (+) Transcript_49346:59-847(+)
MVVPASTERCSLPWKSRKILGTYGDESMEDVDEKWLQMSPLLPTLIDKDYDVSLPIVQSSGDGSRIPEEHEERGGVVLPQRDVFCTGVMACFKLGVQINLAALKDELTNTTYVQGAMRQYLTIKSLREPQYSACVSSGGYVNIITTCSGDDARLAAKRCARLIQKHHNPKVTFKGHRVLNVQAMTQFPFKVNLPSLVEDGVPGFDVVATSPTHVSLKAQQESCTLRVGRSGTVKACQANSMKVATVTLEAVAPYLYLHREWW